MTTVRVSSGSASGINDVNSFPCSMILLKHMRQLISFTVEIHPQEFVRVTTRVYIIRQGHQKAFNLNYVNNRTDRKFSLFKKATPPVQLSLFTLTSNLASTMEGTFSPLDIQFLCYIEEGGGSQVISLIVICNRVRFYISINPNDLRSAESQHTESALEKKYLHFIKRLPAENEVDDDDPPHKSEKKLADWAIQVCKPHFRELTSANPITQYVTLEEYINPTTYALKLVNIHGKLSAESCPVDPFITADIHKTYRIQSSDLPSGSHAYIPASSVNLIDNTRSFYEIAAEKVRLASGSEYFFKRPCLRELQMHQRMKDAQKLPTDLRVTYVQGLVEAKDGSIVGTLLNIIDIKHDLIAAEAPNTETTLSNRKKWLGQVKYIVSKLHNVGIYWGDVQPGNVVIDKKENAWVVDFAGGYTEGFGVSEKNYNSEKGDLEGIENLTKYMGIGEE